ncbi:MULTISPECIES: hypothetical protein [Aerococcus]|nr:MULTISPECIES: hypothetical protein [Aerococcus]MDK6371973.1 hypothetical protein [Aerococcus urinae]MDK7802272.1 hypothetical protein [Aerococcus urinae]MDK8655923.1 hypothetical protein [Aerococcus urinae]WIW74005.1 hypothetical protein DBT50_002830 [Aerococcus tenax]
MKNKKGRVNVFCWPDPDKPNLSKDYVGRWRLWNGQDWTHSIETKENALYFGEKFGAKAIGFCTKDKDGEAVYKHVTYLHSPWRVCP